MSGVLNWAPWQLLVVGWRNVRRAWRWLMKPSDIDANAPMRRLPVISAILNRRPFQAFLVSLFFSHGVLIILNWVVYGMLLRPSYWWASSFYGDFFLALAIWALAIVAPYARKLSWQRRNKFLDMLHWLLDILRRLWWVRDVVIIAAAYWVAWQHMLQEHDSIGSWERHFGATSSYHNLTLYALLGYTLVRLLMRALWVLGGVLLSRKWSHLPLCLLALVGALLCIYFWHRAGVYDGTYPLAPNGQPKILYSAPIDGWQNARISWEWLVHGFRGIFG